MEGLLVNDHFVGGESNGYHRYSIEDGRIADVETVIRQTASVLIEDGVNSGSTIQEEFNAPLSAEDTALLGNGFGYVTGVAPVAGTIRFVNAAGRGLSRVGTALTRVDTPPSSATGASQQADDIVDSGTRSGDETAEAANNNFDHLVRGDSRTPDEIFENGGFQPRDPNDSITIDEHVANNPLTSQYVSTSISDDVGIQFATNNGTRVGYVYEIDPVVSGIDVNDVIPHNTFFDEFEIAVPNGIPSNNIRGARRVEPDGTVGEFIPNPNYNPSLRPNDVPEPTRDSIFWYE